MDARDFHDYSRHGFSPDRSFVDREAEADIRVSAQGHFMIMTNGLGAFAGGRASGCLVDHFTVDGV
jgi:NHS family xanthosine MFS transporter